jgi:fused signal recognition particle receptor
MFSFFKKFLSPGSPPAQTTAVDPAKDLRDQPQVPAQTPPSQPSSAAAPPLSEGAAPNPPAVAPRQSWLTRLKDGLRKTGSSLTSVFAGTRIDEALYEELESALLMADAGVACSPMRWPICSNRSSSPL